MSLSQQQIISIFAIAFSFYCAGYQHGLSSGRKKYGVDRKQRYQRRH